MAQGRLPPKAARFDRLGTLKDSNGRIYKRDIGCTGTLDGVPFWLFGDTFPCNDAGKPIGLYTSTGAVGDVHNPTKNTYWSCDQHGKPPQFIPFSNEEAKFNRENAAGGQKRFFLWSFSSIAETSPGEGWIFFVRGQTQSHHLKDNIGHCVQIARIKLNPDRKSATVSRVSHIPLFQGGCHWGTFATLVERNKGFIYVYGSQEGHIYVARVPLDKPTDTRAYEYWTTQGWSKDESKKTQCFWKLQSGTIFWNRFYKCFMMIGCTSFADNKIMVRTAPQPEGPWTGDHLLHQLYKPRSGFNYCVYAHPWSYPESQHGQMLISWTDQGTGVVELAKLTFEGYRGKPIMSFLPSAASGLVNAPPYANNTPSYSRQSLKYARQYQQQYSTHPAQQAQQYGSAFPYYSQYPPPSPQYGQAFSAHYGVPYQYPPPQPGCNSWVSPPSQYDPNQYFQSSGNGTGNGIDYRSGGGSGPNINFATKPR
ncbi:hypothetical protein V1512DRAFT_267112 [Lipomyces arxii]|uniref:uncharacterized protein n=1 Tax=Lipomyces arxii TaxID=56418 RepID=UPI0034CFDAC4